MGLIQQIPQAIFQSIGFMAILFLVFEGIQFWFKPSSNQKYWLACIFYGIALVQFLFEVLVAQEVVIFPLLMPVELPNQVQWMTLIGFIYLAIVVGYFIYFLFKWTRLQQLRFNANFNLAIPADDWLEEQVQKAGSNRKIKIGFSNQIDGPVTFGWLQPVILMPFSLSNHISIDEMKFILLHELAHILRNDFIIHLLVEIAQLILCFNPFSYYFGKIIQLEREKACDEWVVAQTNAPVLYTKALYQLAKYNCKKNNHLSLAALDTESELLIRIKHINSLITPRITTKALLSKLIIGIGLSVLLLLNSAPIETKVNNTLHMQVSKPISSIQSHIEKIVKYKKQIVLTQSSPTITNHKPKFIKSISKSTIVMNNPRIIESDTSYLNLLKATIAWIKQREINQNNAAVFAKYDENNTANEYSVAEQLLLRAVLHKYELKRTIIANAISKASSQEDAMSIIQQSKEWIELQQYEKWASRFLKQHPNLNDTSKQSDF